MYSTLGTIQSLILKVLKDILVPQNLCNLDTYFLPIFNFEKLLMYIFPNPHCNYFGFPINFNPNNQRNINKINRPSNQQNV